MISANAHVFEAGPGLPVRKSFFKDQQPQSKSVIHRSQRSQTWPRLQIVQRVQKSCFALQTFPLRCGDSSRLLDISTEGLPPVLAGCGSHGPERAFLFSSSQQGQPGVTLEHLDILNFHVSLRTLSPPALFVIPASPVLVLCSTPLLSDRAVYSGCVGWSVLFSRASCFAAAPKCLFLFQIFRDLFVTGISVRASAERART